MRRVTIAGHAGPSPAAFTSLESAIRHHLDVVASALQYDPKAEGNDPDLSGAIAPVAPILARVDPLVATPREVSQANLDALVAFVGKGLLDPRATPEHLRRVVPERLPRGRTPLRFEFPSR